MEQDALRGDDLQRESEFYVEELLESLQEAGKPRTNELGVPRGEVSQLDEEGKYDKWGHNENPWKESDILIDEETGWRYQMWNVGMTRNAKAENRKIEKVFLDPIRHVSKEQNIPLRGWYQSKFNESPLARPRPCMTDALLTQPYGGTCNVGCSFCIAGETKINTPKGLKRIDEIKKKDVVLGRDNNGVVAVLVVDIVSRVAESYYNLTTETSHLKITGNHPVFVVGKGWTPVNELKVGDRIEKILSKVRRSSGNRISWNVLRCMQKTSIVRSIKGKSKQQKTSRKMQDLWCGYSNKKKVCMRKSRVFASFNEPSCFRKPEREEACKTSSTMQELWGACSNKDEGASVLRQSRVCEGGKRVPRYRKHIWKEVKGKDCFCRDKSENECCYASTSSKSGERETEICRVEEENGSESQGWYNWIQNFKENAICEEGWEEGNLPVGVGVVDMSVVRQTQHPLGIRARSFGTKWGGVSSRFQETRYKLLHRSEGMVSRREETTDAEVYASVPNRNMGHSRTEASRHSTVVKLEKVEHPLEVWDIQTECENFYAEGILLHNCYINSGIRGYRGQGITVVDPKYPDKVRKQLSRMKTATAGYMSSFIDPFMELEPHYKNTYRTATAFLDNKLPMFFLTRKTAPDWVYDYLKQNPYSYMQFSINTSSHDDWKRLSPRANPLQMQIDQVRAMHEAGIYVSIQVNPICAGITSNEDIVKLIHMLAEAGADHLIFKFVEIVTFSRKGMVQGMRERFHDADGGGGNTRVDLFDYLFSEIIGGFYTIKEDYRKAALDLFADECKRAGVTMATCYEYEYGRNAKGEIINKTGTSMGSKYLTADQCHGHRVPMFTRDSTDDPWKEIKGCPPSGCLTCQDDRPNREVACHNPLLASAPALTPGDLLEPAMLPKGSQNNKFRIGLKMVQKG